MSSELYPQLKSAVESLIASTNVEELSKNTPESREELVTRIEAIWEPCRSIALPSTVSGQASSSSSASNEKRLEMIRSVIELVGRDVVVTPLIDGELEEPDGDDISGRESFVAALSYRLDVVLTLYEVVFASVPQALTLEPGALFIPLLEDLVELLSIELWRDLWQYVETRSKRFTKDMPASKGKALPLLRIINSFLRFLPRTPEDLVFRGRVHQFAGSVISVADKSAVNMRGDYNDLQTTWDEDVKPEAEVEGEDVKMDDKEDTKEKFEKQDSDFYSTLWSLQQYFSNPPNLDGLSSSPLHSTNFAQFKSKTDFVLPKLFEQTLREKATAGSNSSSPSTSPSSKKRKRIESEEGDEKTFFHPRYLTGRQLLSHELADPSFRRQILVQYFILFQFLLNLTPDSVGKQAFTGGMPKSFIVGPEDQVWVGSKIKAIKEELRKMGKDGKSFESTLLSVITRERHYAQWKNENSPEWVFDIRPLVDDSAKKAAEGWKKHCGPPPRFPFKLGSRPLSALWRNGFENIDQLKGWKRSSTVMGLEEELKSVEENIEDDKAMGKEPSAEDQASYDEMRIKNTWRGLRLASHASIHLFQACREKRDLHKLVAAMNGDVEKQARSTPARAAEAEDEAVAVMDSLKDVKEDREGSGVATPGGDVEMAS